MNGKTVLYIDQHGGRYACQYVNDLKRVHCLTGKISRMYVDSINGKRYHVGYVVGQFWLRAYTPFKEVTT